MRTFAFSLAGLLLLAYFWFAVDALLNRRRFRVVYVGSNLAVTGPNLRAIVARYIPDPALVDLVEPGAGLAQVTRFLAREHTWKSLTAVDTSFGLLLVARFLNFFQHAPIQFKRGDVLRFAFPKGALIYSYLSTEILERLYTEGKLAGCLVISLTFAIPNLDPTEEIPLSNWQKRLLIYDFRQKEDSHLG